jgi:hypothetical protein
MSCPLVCVPKFEMPDFIIQGVKDVERSAGGTDYFLTTTLAWRW